VLAGAAVTVWFAPQRPKNEEAAQLVLPVETVTPTVGTIERTMTIDSYVQSDSVVTILPKVAGTLTSINAEVGMHLSVGQVIATIDPEPYRLTVNQAIAAYDAATSVYDRAKKLHDSGAASEQSYDQAQAQFDAAKSQLELARLKLGYSTITSPVDGTVILRHVSSGAMVAESVPIVTISNGHTLVIHTEIPETDAIAFERDRATMPIRARIPAMGEATYALRIRNIAPAVDVRTKTFEVQSEIEGDTGGIFPGMFAEVTFVVDAKKNVPYLPFAALVGGDQLWYVNGANAAGRMAFTPEYFNDDYFELPAKYAGYTFILAGQHFLAEGTQVKAVAAGLPAGAGQ
jgi:RND family efflux transporter MFP subunit